MGWSMLGIGGGQGGVRRVSVGVSEVICRMSCCRSGLGSKVLGWVRSRLVSIRVKSGMGMEGRSQGVDKAGGLSCRSVVGRPGTLSKWAKIISSSAHFSSTYVSNDMMSCGWWVS